MSGNEEEVKAETLTLCQHRREKVDGDGPWFGAPIRGFGVRSFPGEVASPIYYFASLSGLQSKAMEFRVEVVTPSGAVQPVGGEVLVFDETRSAFANGRLGPFVVDQVGAYVVRLVVNNQTIASTVLHVIRRTA